MFILFFYCSQFIRVSHDTDPEKVLTLLRNEWRLELPKLLISVTGGAKSFTLHPKLKNVLRQGLLKVKLLTNVGGNFVGESEVEWQRGQKKWYGEAIPSDACFQDLSFLRLRGKLQYGLKSSF